MQEFFHCHFFKSNIRIFRKFFSDNTSIKLLLLFTEDGPVCGRKVMTGYLRQKHNVAITEKRVDTALSLESSQFRTQTKKIINNNSSKYNSIQSRLFWP